MPEREQPQERPDSRRRRDSMTEHRSSPPRAQHLAVIDAVRAERDRGHQRHHLPARMSRPRPLTQIDGPIDQILDLEPPREQRREHHTRVRDNPLIIEHNHRRLVHHDDDLLDQGRDSRNLSLPSPIQEVTEPNPPDRTVD